MAQGQYARVIAAGGARGRTFLLWRGPSALDGSDILAIAIPASANSKTGAMLSIAILPASGQHRKPQPSVCAAGSDGKGCPFALTGGCYVNWAFGVAASRDRLLDAIPFASDETKTADVDAVRRLAGGMPVRFGERGDPAALPRWLLQALADGAGVRTGYTHVWNDERGSDLSALMMGSTENEAATREAWRKGWRTYRVRPIGAPLLDGEIDCPSNRGVSCADCGLCSGASGRAGSAPSISIEAHGGAVAAKVSNRIAQG